MKTNQASPANGRSPMKWTCHRDAAGLWCVLYYIPQKLMLRQGFVLKMIVNTWLLCSNYPWILGPIFNVHLQSPSQNPHANFQCYSFQVSNHLASDWLWNLSFRSCFLLVKIHDKRHCLKSCLLIPAEILPSAVLHTIKIEMKYI